jgi:hypothetical protein
MSEEMDFPPGEPTGHEDPRQLLNELWRAHDRTRDGPYGERYVTFMPLIERAGRLTDSGWGAFQKLYQREHTRRRLAPGTELEWMERAAQQRAAH